eukprot:jgi/Bigna1/142585/aug1.71_g17293
MAKTLAAHFNGDFSCFWKCIIEAISDEESDGYLELVAISGFGETSVNAMLTWVKVNRDACEDLAKAVALL